MATDNNDAHASTVPPPPETPELRVWRVDITDTGLRGVIWTAAPADGSLLAAMVGAAPPGVFYVMARDKSEAIANALVIRGARIMLEELKREGVKMKAAAYREGYAAALRELAAFLDVASKCESYTDARDVGRAAERQDVSEWIARHMPPDKE